MAFPPEKQFPNNKIVRLISFYTILDDNNRTFAVIPVTVIPVIPVR